MVVQSAWLGEHRSGAYFMYVGTGAQSRRVECGARANSDGWFLCMVGKS